MGPLGTVNNNLCVKAFEQIRKLTTENAKSSTTTSHFNNKVSFTPEGTTDIFKTLNLIKVGKVFRKLV